MTITTTYNATAIAAPDGAFLAAYEAATGLDPGTVADLHALNVGSASAVGAPNAAGWTIHDIGAGFIAAADVNFGPLVAPVSPIGFWKATITFLPTGDPPPAGTALALMAGNEAGDAMALLIGFDTLSGFTFDGGTLTADSSSIATNIADMDALITALAGGDFHAQLIVDQRNGIDGTQEDTYLPIIDSIQLRIDTPEAPVTVSNCHIETAHCMLIAVPLNTECAIVEGAPVYVTSGVGTITPTVERENATDYSAKNWGGEYCGPNQKGVTLEKWLNLEGEFCLLDWGFMAATSGNVKMTDVAGNVIGYQALRRVQSACAGNPRPRFALTVIRAASTGDGGCVTNVSMTGATSAVAYTYPNVTDFVWDIPKHEDARAMVPFKAVGYNSPNARRGPLNLLPATATPATIDPLAYYAAYFVDPAALPTVNCDVQIDHPAPLPA